jgi:3-oxoacyl-(acyl-carrier-protein) synthase
VTGLGAITPIGSGRRELWDGLLAGRCGFAPVATFDTSGLGVHLGAEVRGFDPAPSVRRTEPGKIGRASQMVIVPLPHGNRVEAGYSQWLWGKDARRYREPFLALGHRF